MRGDAQIAGINNLHKPDIRRGSSYAASLDAREPYRVARSHGGGDSIFGALHWFAAFPSLPEYGSASYLNACAAYPARP